MQRFLDKWGLWFALVVVGSIITYGLVSGLMKAEEPVSNKPVQQAAPVKAFD